MTWWGPHSSSGLCSNACVSHPGRRTGSNISGASSDISLDEQVTLIRVLSGMRDSGFTSQGFAFKALRETENTDFCLFVFDFFFFQHGERDGYKYWVFCSLWEIEWLCFCSQSRHQLEETKKEKRTRIPYKPNYSLNLWSIMKNCIGKELSKIPMAVRFWHGWGAASRPSPPGPRWEQWCRDSPTHTCGNLWRGLCYLQHHKLFLKMICFHVGCGSGTFQITQGPMHLFSKLLKSRFLSQLCWGHAETNTAQLLFSGSMQFKGDRHENRQKALFSRIVLFEVLYGKRFGEHRCRNSSFRPGR